MHGRHDHGWDGWNEQLEAAAIRKMFPDVFAGWVREVTLINGGKNARDEEGRDSQ